MLSYRGLRDCKRNALTTNYSIKKTNPNKSLKILISKWFRPGVGRYNAVEIPNRHDYPLLLTCPLPESSLEEIKRHKS